jgi:hypothetical protein
MMSDSGSQRLGSQQLPAPDSQLRRRREQLAEEVAELHWNLGGLAYEMAIRDHFRLDVLIRRAAMLQERDAELAEVERMLHMQESGSAGNCTNCGAVRSRGAVFCWQCGEQVMQRSSAVSDADADDGAGAGANGNGNVGGHHPANQLLQADPGVDTAEPPHEGPADDLHGIGRPVHTSP